MNTPYILYVEDDEIEVMKFLHALKDYDVAKNIKVATDGEQGWQRLEENRVNPPRLIILDINMPKLNGLELLSKIKNDKDFQTIPVIMLTTSENQKDIETSFKNQVAGYFVKPFEPEKYNEIIASINRYWTYSQTLN